MARRHGDDDGANAHILFYRFFHAHLRFAIPLGTIRHCLTTPFSAEHQARHMIEDERPAD